MEEEQQFGTRQALTIAKRRFWWILVPALLGPAIGIGLTFLVQPIYTSKAFVLIEQPKVPDKFVTSVLTDHLDTRLMTLQEQILSRSRLEPIVQSLGLAKDGSKSQEDTVEQLRKSIEVKMIQPEGSSSVPSGFYITAQAKTASTAQKICTEILSMFMSENLKLREQRAAGTTEFLGGQLEESKRKLDENDAKLAEFKEKYLGQLPTDEQRNLEMMMSTRARLETVNQEMVQAQQQRMTQESALSQRKAAPAAGNPDNLQQELTALRSQLSSLQARYTDEHPDVRKAKAQIRVLENQLEAADAKAAAAPLKEDAADNSVDTPEIRQMRAALRFTDDNVRSKRAEQLRLEGDIRNLQARLQLSPVVEERYKALTRDHESALLFYNELLSKKTQSEMSTDLERRQEGEQFVIMDAPNRPVKPTFPEPIKFGLGGLGAGLILGMGLAFLIERREDFIRTEEDVVHVLGLPVLVGIPEVVAGPREDVSARQKAEV
jgi:polysaccharide chain length determinant protein (PEP-CTERM system associated)